MINDSLIQLGKDLQKEHDDIRQVTKRVTKFDPIVEKTKDKIDVLNAFYMEFYTYGDSSVLLDIKIFSAPRSSIYG